MRQQPPCRASPLACQLKHRRKQAPPKPAPVRVIGGAAAARAAGPVGAAARRARRLDVRRLGRARRERAQALAGHAPRAVRRLFAAVHEPGAPRARPAKPPSLARREGASGVRRRGRSRAALAGASSAALPIPPTPCYMLEPDVTSALACSKPAGCAFLAVHVPRQALQRASPLPRGASLDPLLCARPLATAALASSGMRQLAASPLTLPRLPRLPRRGRAALRLPPCHLLPLCDGEARCKPLPCTPPALHPACSLRPRAPAAAQRGAGDARRRGCAGQPGRRQGRQGGGAAEAHFLRGFCPSAVAASSRSARRSSALKSSMPRLAARPSASSPAPPAPASPSDSEPLSSEPDASLPPLSLPPPPLPPYEKPTAANGPVPAARAPALHMRSKLAVYCTSSRARARASRNHSARLTGGRTGLPRCWRASRHAALGLLISVFCRSFDPAPEGAENGIGGPTGAPDAASAAAALCAAARASTFSSSASAMPASSPTPSCSSLTRSRKASNVTICAGAPGPRPLTLAS